MKFVEIFLVLYIALMMVATKRWIDQAKKGIVSIFNQHLVVFVFAILILITQIVLPYPSIIIRIGYIMLSLLVVIYFLDFIIGGSEASHEDARVWIGWTMFFLGVTGFVALVMDYLTTNQESYQSLIGVAIAVFTPVYRWLMERKTRVESQED